MEQFEDSNFSEEEIFAEDNEPNYEKVNFFLAIGVPLICFTSNFVSYLSAKVTRFYFKPSAKETELIKTMGDLKKEMAAIPMVNEFAKYSKVKRKLNLVTIDYEATVGCRQSMAVKMEGFIKIGLHILLALFTAFLIFRNRYIPVFIVPDQWFYPLSAILAYPTGVPGAVSIMVWFFVVRSMVQITSSYKMKNS